MQFANRYGVGIRLARSPWANSNGHAQNLVEFFVNIFVGIRQYRGTCHSLRVATDRKWPRFKVKMTSSNQDGF